MSISPFILVVVVVIIIVVVVVGCGGLFCFLFFVFCFLFFVFCFLFFGNGNCKIKKRIKEIYLEMFLQYRDINLKI